MRHSGPVAVVLAVGLLLAGTALVAGVGLLAAETLQSTDSAAGPGAGGSAADQSPIIRDVVPASRPNLTGIHPIPIGETMLVRGVTNLRSDQNVIFVEVVRGPDADRFGTAQAPPWGTDGVWTVRIDVPGNTTPGNYTIRAEDGSRRYSVDVEFVEQLAANATDRPTDATPTPETTPTTTEATTPTTATASPATPTTTPTTTVISATPTTPPTTTVIPTATPGQPGFTPAIAALAMVLAALLSRR